MIGTLIMMMMKADTSKNVRFVVDLEKSKITTLTAIHVTTVDISASPQPVVVLVEALVET